MSVMSILQILLLFRVTDATSLERRRTKDGEDEDPSRNFLFVVSSIASNMFNLPVKNKYPIDIISKENTNDNAGIVTECKCLSGNVVTLVATACLILQNTNDDDDENGVRCLAIDGSTFLSLSRDTKTTASKSERVYSNNDTQTKASLLFGEKEKREGRVSERYRSGEFGG